MMHRNDFILQLVRKCQNNFTFLCASPKIMHIENLKNHGGNNQRGASLSSICLVSAISTQPHRDCRALLKDSKFYENVKILDQRLYRV